MADETKHDPFAAMRSRNYRLFASGWLPASVGLQMLNMALGWEIYERTRDPLALGLIGLARTLPTVALALPAGQLIDMLNRRRVLTLTQMWFTIACVLLAGGSFAWEHGYFGEGTAGLWVMLGLTSLTGCARVFNGPSRSSLLPLIVPGGATGPAFHNAVTWNSGIFQLAATVGPLVAGAMIWLTDAAWPVYLVTAAACFSFACTSQLIDLPEEEKAVQHSIRDVLRMARPSVMLPGILEGARHVWREHVVLGAIALDLFAVLLGGATALMPIYATEILHVGPVGLGALKAAPYIGALLMALVLANRRPFTKAGPALLWSVAGFGVCTIIFGLSTSVWVSLAMLAIGGALDNISVVVRHVLVSVRTPDRLRGRVAAVNSVFIECSNELGGFESGLVAKLFTPVISVVSGGIGTILVVVGMALWLPALRRLGRLDTEAVEPPVAAVEAPVARSTSEITVP